MMYNNLKKVHIITRFTRDYVHILFSLTAHLCLVFVTHVVPPKSSFISAH